MLNSPPTKQYAHLVVEQHFLKRFVSSSMLLSSFPSQNSFTSLGWASENAGSTLHYVVLLLCPCWALWHTLGQGYKRRHPNNPIERLQKWVEQTIIYREKSFVQSHQFPSVPDHAKLLAGQPEGTQSTIAATHSTLHITLSYNLTVKSHTPFSLFIGSTDLLWRSMQRADRPWPCHGLLRRSRRPSADWGPRIPVGMVRQLPWLLAIATCAMTISSPRSHGGPTHSRKSIECHSV